MVKIKNNELFKKCMVLVLALVLIATTVFTQFVSAEEMGEWKEVAPMSKEKNFFCTEVINRQIYTFGGATKYERLNLVEAYNPETDTWTAKATMPRPRKSFRTEYIDGKVYVIGGIDDKGFCGELDVYDPTTDTWSTKSPMMLARSGFQTEVVNGKIYVMGGIDTNGKALKNVEEYDPLTDKWTNKTLMRTNKRDFETQVIDGKIYAMGGYDEEHNMSNSLEEYDPILNTWKTKSPMNIPRTYFRTTVFEGKIYAIGQRGYKFIEVYDASTDVWTKLAPMKNDRYGFQMEVMNGEIYIIGGVSTDENRMSAVEVYNPSIDEWRIKPSLITARDEFETAILSGKIYALGGRNKTNNIMYSVEVYDTNASNPTLTVTPSAEKVKVGNEFTTTIGIHNVKNIFAEDIKITYDTERFEYIGAEAKAGIKICNADTNTATPGTIRFVLASLGQENAATDDKDLLDLKFKAKKPGQGKVDIIKGRIADNATLEIDVADENCGEAIITVEASTDVNRSGETTLLDLGIDAGYYNMKAEDTDSTKYDADIMPNGIIDDEDLITITGDLLVNKNYPPNNA